MAILFAHLSEPPPRLGERRPALPAGLDPVLARALAKAPQDRFPSCGEFGDALRAALGLAPYDPDSVTRPRTEIARPGLAPQVSTTQETEATSPVKSQQPIFQLKMGPEPLDTVESRLSEPVPGKGRWRTPVVSAAAAVVLTAGIAIAVALAVQGPAAPTPGTSGTGGAGLAATRPAGSGRGSQGAAASATAPAIGSSSAGTPAATGGPSGIWIAQLASVPLSAGTAALDSRLASVQKDVPGARVLTSSDYASLRAGYWVIYYDGGFASGTDALDFCAAWGLATENQCIGRYLSHDAADFGYQCKPPPPGPVAACIRP